MKGFLGYIAVVLFRMGGAGLFALGVLDSSFLFMPLGNDLLMVALAANHHVRVPYYAVMATAGSVFGCFLVDAAMRKGGERGLEKYLSRRRMAYIKQKIDRRAGWAVAFASLMPPPFPFTPFVAGAAAFQYSRRKMLGIIGATRFVRFSVEGLLAIRFGKSILGLAESAGFQYAVIALVVISIGGSAFSVARWIQRSRRPRAMHAGG